MAKPTISRRPSKKGPQTAPPTACVGIVAGAGGADTLGRLFAELPADSGACFIVTMGHDSVSSAGELVGRIAGATAMPVSNTG